MPEVFFFRGLSTYGHDHAKWSIFDFGPIFKNFARALPERGISLLPVLGMGSGSLLEIRDRARAFILQHSVWRDSTRPVYFLGHSAGGLVARLVLSDLHARGELPEGKVTSLLTIASPHRGSHLAQVCVDMPDRYWGSALFFKSCGYDISRRRDFFIELTPPYVDRLFQKEIWPPSVLRTSLVCSAPRAEWCWPLRVAHRLHAFRSFALPSDGVVEAESQPFGEVIAHLRIDHFRQVGLFDGPQMFENMCDVIADFYQPRRRG